MYDKGGIGIADAGMPEWTICFRFYCSTLRWACSLVASSVGVGFNAPYPSFMFEKGLDCAVTKTS
jgi:hypothetical protein